MAVETFINRTDTAVLTGPLDELYLAAGPIIRQYVNRGWTLQQSRTDPNAGPQMTLIFFRERVE
jgi:hypothetical protein